MLTIILLSLTALYIYERTVMPFIVKRIKFLNHEPMNCIYCVSIWIGIGLAYCTYPLYEMESLMFISLPLLYRITQIKLLK